MARPLLLAIVIAALATSSVIGADVDTDVVPLKFSVLKKTLPNDDGRTRDRRDALLRFAESDRPAVSERVKAALALTKSKSASSSDKLDEKLLLARLYGVARNAKQRKKSLLSAKALSASSKKVSGGDIDAVIDADTAFSSAQKLLKKKKKPIPDDVKATLVSGIAAARALGDAPSEGAYRLLVALIDEDAGKSAGALLSTTNKLLRAGGTHRDLAAVRVDVRRLRARLLSSTGKWADAVHESLVADRAVMLSPKKPWAEPKSDDVYKRSRASADLCFAARDHGVDCGQIEEEKMGARTFYDFSKERGARFSSTRAAVVHAEFDALLKRCVHIDESLSKLDHRVEFEWTVSANGVVDDFNILKPRFLATGPFQSCAQDAFAMFRYPRFKGPAATVGFELNI